MVCTKKVLVYISTHPFTWAWAVVCFVSFSVSPLHSRGFHNPCVLLFGPIHYIQVMYVDESFYKDAVV